MQNLDAERRLLLSDISELEDQLEDATDPKLKAQVESQLNIKNLMLEVVDIERKYTGEDNNKDSPDMKKWRQELSLAVKKLKYAMLKASPTPLNQKEQEQMKQLKDDIDKADPGE